MIDSLIAEARVGRLVAVNGLASKANGSTPKVAKLAEHAPIIFKSVRGPAGLSNAGKHLAKRNLEQISGYVTWFDTQKAYGEFTCEKTQKIVRLRMKMVRRFGLNTVVAGTWIEARCKETPRGVQAQELVSVVPPQPKAEVYSFVANRSGVVAAMGELSASRSHNEPPYFGLQLAS